MLPCQLFLRIKVISLFAVLRNVQSFDLVLFWHAHASDQVDDLEQHEGSYQRKNPRNQNAHELVTDLAPMSVKAAHGFAGSKDGVDHLLSEDAGEQRSNCAARPVDAESIQRVIIPEDGLYLGYHPIAHRPGDNTDGQRRHGATESGRPHTRHES